MPNDLFQSFVEAARQAMPWEGSEYARRYNTTRQRQEERRANEGGGGLGLGMAQAAVLRGIRDEYDNAIAGDVRNRVQQWGDTQSSALKDMRQQRVQEIENTRKTALQQLMEERQRLRQQAEQALSKPPQAPIAVPSFNPIDAVTNVDTNAALAGNNAATQQFYTMPESTASRFSVGAPIGGGIGGRTKRSTRRIVGETDTLGSKRKDEL